MPDPNLEQPSHVENDAEPAAATNGAASAAEPDPFAVLENLNAENALLKDRVLRTMAEMENLRRRTDKEVADSKIYAVSNFAREMLNVADNLHRALANVPADADMSGPIKTVVEGVDLTERDLLSRLARFGVKLLDPQGKKFDPNMQEALFEVPDETVPTGTVVQVVESGYAIGDRVLRPAKVGVSRGGPKAVND